MPCVGGGGGRNQWYKHRHTHDTAAFRGKLQTWSVSAVILQIKMLGLTGVKSDILNKPLMSDVEGISLRLISIHKTSVSISSLLLPNDVLAIGH